MGFFKNPLKKLKKVAKVAQKLDPVGSKIAKATSPAVRKFLSEDKNKRLYQGPAQVRESTKPMRERMSAGSEEMEN
jgi:hypothetical protein